MLTKAQMAGVEGYKVGPKKIRVAISEAAFWLSVVAFGAWAIGFVTGVIYGG